MENKIAFNKKDFITLLLMAAAAAVFAVVFMCITGNMPQVYNDLVLEWTAWVRSNKSAEIFNLRFLIFAGVVAVALYFKFNKPSEVSAEGKGVFSGAEIVAWLCSIVVLKFLIFQQVSTVIVLALCFACMAYMIDKSLLISTVYNYFLSYYVLYALYHICNFLVSYKIVPISRNIGNVSSAVAMVFAVICTGLPLFFANRAAIQKKIILLFQMIVPALFLILSIKKYNYGGTDVIIGIPHTAKFFIAIMIVACFCDALIKCKKNWHSEELDINKFLNIGTCIAIMCFNVFSSRGAIVSEDLHHPFENIFAFQQIFELGQVPFKDFIPPSGLYSVVHGLFFRIFGNGNVAYLSLSDNIYFMTIIALTLVLLKFHVPKIWCFAVAIFLQFSTYNRTMFIALVALLLLLPQLVARKNLWLKVFLLVSVFHGLYYPVYGVAVFAGFIPMFAIQLKSLLSEIANGKQKISSVKFLLPWVCTFAVLFASVPMLWGTFIHIKAMSSQSVLADGISIFGQTLPNWFMPYAKLIFKYPIYNAMHIVPLAFMIWLPFMMLCKIAKGDGTCSSRNCREIAKFFAENKEQLTLCLSLFFIPLISYSFSFVRVDINTFFARSWHALIGVFILYAVFFAKYTKNNYVHSMTLVLLNILIVASFGVGVEQIERKMFSKFDVQGHYKFVEQFDDFKTVKKCFLSEGVINSLNYEKNKLAEIDGETSFGKYGYGHLYIFRQKGGTGFILKSFSAAKEAKNILNKHKHLVGAVSPLDNYYLFNWLMTSGDYVWSKERNSFVHNKNISNWADLKNINSSCPLFYENYDLGNSADVFGLSYKSLQKIFKKHEMNFSVSQSDFSSKTAIVNFDDYVAGKDADFIYIEFEKIENEYITTNFDMRGEHEYAPNKLTRKLFTKKKPNPNMRVTVSFYDDFGGKHSVHCNYGNGKLLINLGAGYHYLISNHDKLEIEVSKNGERFQTPNIAKIDFLKCRQIYEDKFDYHDAEHIKQIQSMLQENQNDIDAVFAEAADIAF